MVLTYEHVKISLNFGCLFIPSVSSILLSSLLVGINICAWKQMHLKYTFVICFMDHNHGTVRRTGRTKMIWIPQRKPLRNALWTPAPLAPSFLYYELPKIVSIASTCKPPTVTIIAYTPGSQMRQQMTYRIKSAEAEEKVILRKNLAGI